MRCIWWIQDHRFVFEWCQCIGCISIKISSVSWEGQGFSSKISIIWDSQIAIPYMGPSKKANLKGPNGPLIAIARFYYQTGYNVLLMYKDVFVPTKEATSNLNDTYRYKFFYLLGRFCLQWVIVCRKLVVWFDHSKEGQCSPTLY